MCVDHNYLIDPAGPESVDQGDMAHRPHGLCEALAASLSWTLPPGPTDHVQQNSRAASLQTQPETVLVPQAFLAALGRTAGERVVLKAIVQPADTVALRQARDARWLWRGE